MANTGPLTPTQISIVRTVLEKGGSFGAAIRIAQLGTTDRRSAHQRLHLSGWRVGRRLVRTPTRNLRPDRAFTTPELITINNLLFDEGVSEREVARRTGFGTREQFRAKLQRSGWRIVRELVPITQVEPADLDDTPREVPEGEDEEG